MLSLATYHSLQSRLSAPYPAPQKTSATDPDSLSRVGSRSGTGVEWAMKGSGAALASRRQRAKERAGSRKEGSKNSPCHAHPWLWPRICAHIPWGWMNGYTLSRLLCPPRTAAPSGFSCLPSCPVPCPPGRSCSAVGGGEGWDLIGSHRSDITWWECFGDGIGPMGVVSTVEREHSTGIGPASKARAALPCRSRLRRGRATRVTPDRPSRVLGRVGMGRVAVGCQSWDRWGWRTRKFGSWRCCRYGEVSGDGFRLRSSWDGYGPVTARE